MSSEKRRKLLIEPRFQVQLMLRMAAWAVLATLITGGCILFFLTMADQKAAGDFFFVVPEAGTHPVMFNRVQIVLPALAISLAVNLVLGVFFTLLYSQRLAGPLDPGGLPNALPKHLTRCGSEMGRGLNGSIRTSGQAGQTFSLPEVRPHESAQIRRDLAG